MNDHDDEHIFEGVARALSEDIGGGDVTAALIPHALNAHARVIAKERGILCGRRWFDRVFAALDPNVQVTWQVEDGALVAPGTVVCDIVGNARVLLTGERMP